MKMATKHFKVVFIAILNYLREQWFYSLVVYRNPPRPLPITCIILKTKLVVTILLEEKEMENFSVEL